MKMADLKMDGRKSCPDCGSDVRWIEDYDSWYCDNCKEYKNLPLKSRSDKEEWGAKVNRGGKIEDDYKEGSTQSQQTSYEYYEEKEENWNSQQDGRRKGEDERGWSKGKFVGYLLATLIMAYSLASLSLPDNFTIITISLGSIFILPVCLSILGLRYSKAKYGRYLWNAKTYIPPAELFIGLILVTLYLFILSGIITSLFFLHFGSLLLLIILFHLLGLQTAYGIGWWRERKTMLDEINKCGHIIDIGDLAYHFGIKKSSAKKQVEILLSNGELNGRLDEENDYILKPGVKDDILCYLWEYRSKGEISLQDISNHFQIPENMVIKFIRELMEERKLSGEIDQLNGVYRFDEGYVDDEPPKTDRKTRDYDKIRMEIESLQDKVGNIETGTVESALEDGNVERAETLLEEKKQQLDKIGDIKEEMERLQKEEDMIDTRAIESALDDGDTRKANELLNELKENYQEYQDILDDLKELDDRMDKLSKRLAEGEIDNDSFKAAKESVDNKKYDLRNKLDKLRKEVIYEDYQKPF